MNFPNDLRSPARLGARALATDSWACAVPNCWGAWLRVEEDVEMGSNPSPGVFLWCLKNWSVELASVVRWSVLKFDRN